LLEKLQYLTRSRLAVLGVLIVLLAWVGYRVFGSHSSQAGFADSSVLAKETTLPSVSVIEPIRKAAVQSVTLPATVDAFEKATLYAKVSGYLQSIRVDKGDRVRQGQELARIAVPEMENEYVEAKAAVQEAQAAADRAQSNAELKTLTLQRLQGVRQDQPDVISQQEVDVARAEAEVAEGDLKIAKAKLEMAKARRDKLETLLKYTTIRAPYAGIITDRFVDPGALIQTATNSTASVAPVVSIATIDTVRAYVHVPEPDVPLVKTKQAGQLRLDALPGRVFRGSITRSTVVLDPQTRTMKIEIDLRNPDDLIRPGMFGNATLEFSVQPNAIFLPTEALHKDPEGSNYVFTVTERKLQKVVVQTSMDDGKLVRVTGLSGHESVVLYGAEILQVGALVNSVPAEAR
jgi:membrane fusion protein (multidrug efflux system)